MAIDILNIAPHEVSRDLSGYTVLFYGQPKTGKTTISSRFPDALLLAFEKGYAALPGVKAAPINRWSEFKQVLKQLKSDEAHALYKTIVVDTASYICRAA
jgi:GTPase SAR1 family protein